MSDMVTVDALPSVFGTWFAGRGWAPHAHQLRMVAQWRRGADSLLIAPTGGGKTLAGFLPALVDLAALSATDRKARHGIHTLYLSPLKALAQDIRRNLEVPIAEMGLPIRLASRTGDSTAAERAQQKKSPPDILLTTPESLMLLLSHGDADRLFGDLQAVIVDEIHALMPNKRGDMTALALARLGSLAPGHRRIGLSATVRDPEALAAWLGRPGRGAELLQAEAGPPPAIEILTEPRTRVPIAGYLASYAVDDVYQRIKQAGTTIVFVNTRAQAELMFQALWSVNDDTLPIALHHGSLDRDQRQRVEATMAAGKIRAIVATASLDLGIDWGNVDLVIQVGAPKGVSRLIQRIGRANHRLDEASAGLLVPCNRFEVIECLAATQVLARGELDGETRTEGALDVVVQYITNCACAGPVHPDQIFAEVTGSPLYAHVDRALFDRLVQFAVNGGYVLRHYDQFTRMVQTTDGQLHIATPKIASRHRINIGTIVEEPTMKVKRLNAKGRGGRQVGEVEEYFALGLSKGDSFIFAGELLVFEGIRDLTVEARPAPRAGHPKVPAYAGGRMPLSTHLAQEVRRILATPAEWDRLPGWSRELLQWQARVSRLPTPETLLVETFRRGPMEYLIAYGFLGRKAHQTLGMLITRRLETLGMGRSASSPMTMPCPSGWWGDRRPPTCRPCSRPTFWWTRWSSGWPTAPC